jgi:hypothetical protein
MTHVAVSRLRVRGPADAGRHAAVRAEQALRLAAPDGERLLVLRRLLLGRLPVIGGAALWDARAAAALRDAGGRALHALAPGAALADAVWFASATEARWLLLRELAAGRRVEAWFWRLAVPDWRGASLPEWIPRMLGQALAEPEAEIALARAVLRLVQDGHLVPLLAALDAAPEPPHAVGPTPEAWAASMPPAPSTAPILSLTRHLMARLPTPLPAALRETMRIRPAQGRAAHWLVRLLLLAAAPEAATQPGLLTLLVEAVLAEVVPPIAAAPPLEPVPQFSPAQRVGGSASAPAEPRAPIIRPPPDMPDNPPDSVPPPPPQPSQQLGRRVLARPTSPVPAEAEAPRSDEVFTHAGGLLLLVRPLARMGLPAWLDRYPDLAALGFARALLHHIALRQRMAPGDPLVALLGETGLEHPALNTWRIGLDRWLRRRVRRRLAEVTRRPGWLMIVEDRLTLRFPADAADLRLRRLALDADPGWVPWLGLAIRYDFRDYPAS